MRSNKRMIIVGALVAAGLAGPSLAQDEAPDSEELYDAIRDEAERDVQRLLDAGADANATADRGLPALSYAALHGFSGIADALIAAGADIEAKDQVGATAVSYAAQFGHNDVMSALIEARADVNTVDGSGWTPLIRAAVGGNAEGITILLAAGGDASKESFLGQNPTKIAETNSDQAVLDALNGVTQ